MRKRGISEILSLVDKADKKKKKIEILRENFSPQLVHVLKHIFDPAIKFLIPETFQYKKNDIPDCEVSLYVQARQLYLFVEGGHPTLKQKRREQLFRIFLESLDQKDAELILAMRNKEIPYKTVTKELVMEAFPGFLEKGDLKEYYHG